MHIHRDYVLSITKRILLYIKCHHFIDGLQTYQFIHRLHNFIPITNKTDGKGVKAAEGPPPLACLLFCDSFLCTNYIRTSSIVLNIKLIKTRMGSYAPLRYLMRLSS
jgi:hypothetical protein